MSLVIRVRREPDGTGESVPQPPEFLPPFCPVFRSDRVTVIGTPILYDLEFGVFPLS
jgi:hypothetical protein